ncbi:uncharacterized protein PHACADRAFT_249386 [Phanerochaete carnosa HHB-10118-sp]|uniref:Uncharacterized protein n=1 Tax=Phanerochaete carnosa (strain HHB-10118-sp) TaxID=650164 RepID=K5V8J3_PHACS|nr:uncharacterized protein PHACADRAFT_249386 [Phanerochaete carnosa HHB-10118-sp]EKM59141.1 hypothetical protein PHACADRAFT_249386 [Phanerochaete carnosa HHB-10118-sp]
MSRSPTATTQPPPILPPFSTTSPIVKQQQLSPVQPYFVPPYIQSSVEPQSPVTSQALFVPFRPQLHVHASQLPTPPAYSSPTHTSAQPGPDVKVAVSDISPLPPISASQPMPLPRTNMLKDLAVTLNDAKSSLPQEVTLTSLEDIDRAFEPYEKMMRDLLSKARSGLFAPVGLDPAIVTSVSDDDDTSDDNMDISQ